MKGKRIMKPCARHAAAVAGIFLYVTLAGCDKIYHLLQKEGAEEKELVGEVMAYETNEQVEKIQKLLKLYGYKVGKVDGKLGVNTRNAIKKFQEDQGLKVTRFVDHQTWEVLNGFEECGLVVDAQIQPQAVQQALKNAGEDSGPVDGKMGRRTLAAIKAFQAAHQLKPDGKVGFRTLSALQEYLLEDEAP